MTKELRILLADDDQDDRFFFNKALERVTIATELIAVEDGERLMHFLSENCNALPDVLFLDLNMPRKNGIECLEEIKQSEKLKQLPVIIYSTSLREDIADELYNKGAHYYIRKTDILELQQIIQGVLTLIIEHKFARPPRGKLILNLALLKLI